MDDVSIWIYKKEKQTKISNLPTNSTIKSIISRAQNYKLTGKFEDYWYNEDNANQRIKDLLFKQGRIADANAFYSKTNFASQEVMRMLELEYNYKKANAGKNEMNLSLDDKYFSDLQKYGKQVALKNKKDKEDANKILTARYNVAIDQYNQEKLRVNVEAGKDRVLAEKREQERKKAEAERKALENKKKTIKKEVPVDTPMDIYMKNKIKVDTANEMNESTQSTYRHDLVYLFFKVLLFVVLGIVFYFLMKDQNPQEMITQAKETTKVLSDKVSDGVKTMKETVKEKGAEMIKEIKSKSPDLKVNEGIKS